MYHFYAGKRIVDWLSVLTLPLFDTPMPFPAGADVLLCDHRCCPLQGAEVLWCDHALLPPAGADVLSAAVGPHRIRA